MGKIKPIYRLAEAKDIIQGNTVFINGDDQLMHEFTIEEVLRPNDFYKAFVASDGCRYGLDGCYIQTNKAETDKEKELYYIRNNSGYVGNSVAWWALNGNGYTCDLKKAQKYTREEALRIVKNRPHQDMAYLASEVEKNIEHHVCKLPKETKFQEMDN